MNIPDKAIGAAEDAWYEDGDLEAAITAAAPFIAAQALRDEAERTHTPEHPAFYGHDSYVRGHLLARADELDPQ